MFENAFKRIDDALWKDAGCTSELDYTEQTSWLLFLKYLDALESDKATEAQLDGKKYQHILDKITVGNHGLHQKAKTAPLITIRPRPATT